MKVSAIIPLHNGKKFIYECINSLLTQTKVLHEILIVDDFSTDDGVEFVNKLLAKQQIKYRIISNQSNHGSAFSRNLAIRKAKGDFLLFMDQDDYLDPNFNKEVNQHINNTSSQRIDGLHTSYIIIDENKQKTTEVCCCKISSKEFLGHQFVRNRILSNSGTLVKKSIIEESGLYDESLKFSQDWDLWLRIGKVGVFSYLNKPLTFIRRHSNNTSAQIDGFLKDEIKILKKYSLEFIKDSICKRNLSNYDNEIDFLSILLRLGDWGKLVSAMTHLEKKYPDYFEHYFYFGLLRFKEECMDEAIKYFEKIPSDNRYFYSAQNNLAANLILTGDLRSAEKILHEILTKKPDFQDAGHNLMRLKSADTKQADLKITSRPLRNTLYQYA